MSPLRASSREFLRLAPPILALALLLASASWRAAGGQPGNGWQLAGLVLLGAGCALYRLGIAGAGLGLGAVVLPLALWGWGVSAAGWAAGGGLLLARAADRLLAGPAGERLSLRAARGELLVAGRAALAALAAAATILLVAGRTTDGADRPFSLLAGCAGGVALLLAEAALELLDSGSAAAHATRARTALRWTAPLALTLGGWGLGLALLRTTPALGWTYTLGLLLPLSLLAGETARHGHLRRRAAERVRDIWTVSRAGQRIILRRPGIEGIAAEIREECHAVLPCHWFQLELAAGEEQATSWWSAPDGAIRAGQPAPPPHPPALPGVHRRGSWRLLERELEGDGRTLGRIRLWCDPRQLDPTALELLDALLPQISASLSHVLLERRATRDRLTGLPDRGVLDERLELGFRLCVEEGRPLALVMCDLDHFKRINDRLGHEAGDRALRLVGATLERHRREHDLCCRYGGEEFVLLLEGADGATALAVAERLRRAVALASAGGEGPPLTMSCGAASAPGVLARSAQDLLALADEALYEAKRRGRDRCLLHLGRGRFRTVAGETVAGVEPSPEVSPPRLFS